MKGNQLILSLIGLIFVLSAPGCTSASEEPPIIMPDATLQGTTWTLEAFTKDQTASSPIGIIQIALMFEAGHIRGSAGCNDYSGVYSLELENFLDAYSAEQMSALHVPGATFAQVKLGDIFLV